MYTNDPRISATLALAGLISHLVMPGLGFQSINMNSVGSELLPDEQLATWQGQALLQIANPDNPKIVAQQWVVVTAYSSTPDQTDATPFITASGTGVRDGIVACNFLRFGTRVRFPELYGDKTFMVEDRMALKNSHKIDIWFASREQAKQFGVQVLKVEVLEI